MTAIAAEIYLIHWNSKEAEARVSLLTSLRHRVTYELMTPAVFRQIRRKTPNVFIIDLSRLPSQGRDVAMNIRQGKASRMIPIIFVDGLPEKVAAIKTHLPDAVYSSWARIDNAIKKALENPPQIPIAPGSIFDVFAGTPLVKKLGIRPDTQLALISAPTGFLEFLGKLPANVKSTSRANSNCDLIIWFVKKRTQLGSQMLTIIGHLSDRAGLWIAWPKKGAEIKSDLTQNIVRRTGLQSGIVDYKICSIDSNWSALKFARRKKKV